MRRAAYELWFLPRNLMIGFMHLYRRFISPLYGQVCRYYPSCSRYAVEAYQLRGFLVGSLMTIWRLLRCNPFSPGGVDDVSPGRRQNFFINQRGFVRPIERKA
jgi:putative membrane protein insertion efficiency factor